MKAASFVMRKHPSNFNLVATFHHAFGLPVRTSPSAALGADEIKLRQRLLDEEVNELRAAVAGGDIVGIADALADVVYIAYGTAHCYGINLDSVFAEVHRSNMSKLDESGNVVYRDDGKVLKGSRYRPPDIAAALRPPRRRRRKRDGSAPS